MAKYEHDPSFSTKAIHEGNDPDQWKCRAVVPLISLSTTFKQEAPGVHAGFEYARSGNPTRNCLETCLASLEQGKHCLVFSSGLGANTAICHLLKSGDHIVAMDDLYGGTIRYFQRVAPGFGIEVSFVDLASHQTEHFTAALRPSTKMIWIETPTNPTLKLVDIEKMAAIAKKTHPGVIVCVDNTFATPYFQKPLLLGADIVVHSVTKYINGHSDVLMGAAITNSDEIHERLRFLQNATGVVPSPFDCYLVARSVRTLAIRMQQHEKNAMAIATFLSDHSLVEKVLYPGLPSHPQHELAKRQMLGFSGMVSFYIRGGRDEARKFLQKVKIFALAESLGGFESLVESPSLMTHMSVPEDMREELGITDNFIRISVGLEDAKDLIEDLDQALQASCK